MKKNDSFGRLLEELKKQNERSFLLQAIQTKAEREIAGEDNDKREEQLQSVADSLEKIYKAVSPDSVVLGINKLVDLNSNTNELLTKSLSELSLIRKINEGSLEYDKNSAQYRNTSGRELTSKVSGKPVKPGGYVDFETASDRLSGQAKRVQSNPDNQLKLKTIERIFTQASPSNTKQPVTGGEVLKTKLSIPTLKQSDKTFTEKLKEEVAATKSIFSSAGKGISTAFSVGKGLLTSPKETFGKGVEKVKAAGSSVKDIITTKSDYSAEQGRFKQRAEELGIKDGDKLFNDILARKEKSAAVEKQKPIDDLLKNKTKEKVTEPAVTPVSDKNEENDNFTSAQEVIADKAKESTDLTKEILDVQKEQLKELKIISGSFVSKTPSELPEQKVSTVSKKEEPSGDEGGGFSPLDLLPGKGALKALGRGARAVGRGALSAGKGLLKFTGSRAGMIAGGALAIGAGAYTAYKGYTGASEEEKAGLEEIDAKVKAGELTPEEAEAQKKQLGEATVEKKGGAIGEGGGMAAGAIGGMKAGAAIGTMLGGPIGTGIGALAGGALGAFAGSKAGKVVGEYGGKAVNATKNFFGGVGDKIKGAFGEVEDSYNRGTAGTEAFQNKEEEIARRQQAEGVEFGSERANQIRKEVTAEISAADPTANRLADRAVSVNKQSTSSEKSQGGMVTSTSAFNKGITANKTLFGSEFLGSLVSKKGLETGSFLGMGEKSRSVDSSTDSMMSSDDNRTTTSSNLLGKRVSGGLFGKDKFTISDSSGEETSVSKSQYNKIQALIKDNKMEEAQKELNTIRENSKKLAGAEALISPEESLTPISVVPSSRTSRGTDLMQASIENKDLNREASTQSASVQPIVSNNVSNNNKTVYNAPKPSPRNSEYDGSPLRDYQRRAMVF
jgi:hypothetical protein